VSAIANDTPTTTTQQAEAGNQPTNQPDFNDTQTALHCTALQHTQPLGNERTDETENKKINKTKGGETTNTLHILAINKREVQLGWYFSLSYQEMRTARPQRNTNTNTNSNKKKKKKKGAASV
jgi:hypothetical protein